MCQPTTGVREGEEGVGEVEGLVGVSVSVCRNLKLFYKWSKCA